MQLQSLTDKFKTLPQYLIKELRDYMVANNDFSQASYYELIKARRINNAAFLEKMCAFFRENYNCTLTSERLRNENFRFFLVSDNQIHIKSNK